MGDIYITFQKYQDPDLANEVVTLLEQNNVAYQIEDHNKFFDASFANNKIDANIILKLRKEDFQRANEVLDKFYGSYIGSIDKDYYLFEFTDTELREIISKPDEWGKFDNLLAQKLLKERGNEINFQELESLKHKRINELSEPEKSNSGWIIFGYLTAILGGLFGFIIGWILAYFKRTLPNGQRVYNYREEDRKHGRIIFFLSFFGFAFWILRRFLPYFSE